MFSTRIINFRKRINARAVIELRILGRFLLRDRFASFISLFPILHLFIRYVSASGVGNVCYNVFSFFDRSGKRSRPSGGNISWNRNMHGTCYAYTETRREENQDGTRSIALESVNSSDLSCFYEYTGLTQCARRNSFRNRDVWIK